MSRGQIDELLRESWADYIHGRLKWPSVRCSGFFYHPTRARWEWRAGVDSFRGLGPNWMSSALNLDPAHSASELLTTQDSTIRRGHLKPSKAGLRDRTDACHRVGLRPRGTPMGGSPNPQAFADTHTGGQSGKAKGLLPQEVPPRHISAMTVAALSLERTVSWSPPTSHPSQPTSAPNLFPPGPPSLSSLPP